MHADSTLSAQYETVIILAVIQLSNHPMIPPRQVRKFKQIAKPLTIFRRKDRTSALRLDILTIPLTGQSSALPVVFSSPTAEQFSIKLSREWFMFYSSITLNAINKTAEVQLAHRLLVISLGSLL